MSKQNQIGAIWRRKTRAGGEFLSITIDGKNYVAWQNDYKKEDKHPDFKIYADERVPMAATSTVKVTVIDEPSDLPF